jgi:hypothetical protein
MRVKSILAIGFLPMVAVTGVVNASGSFAADTNRVGVIDERIGHGGSTYSSFQPDGAGDCPARGEERRKVDVIKRIGTGGSTYSSSQIGRCREAEEGQKRVDVIERIGHGGSTYSFSHPHVQTADR